MGCHEGSPEREVKETGVLSGGNLLEGTTTNLELDRLLSKYMPSNAYSKCIKLLHLTKETLDAAARKVVSTQMAYYFPLHTRSHWLAGILLYDHERTQARLKVYDSAPSAVVRKDIHKLFSRIAPTLKITFAKCVRQERDSNDCGLYMLAYIFADALDERIGDPYTVPAKLRTFFHEALKTKLEKQSFLHRLRTIFQESKKSKRVQLNPLLSGGALESDEDDVLLRDLAPEAPAEPDEHDTPDEPDELTRKVIVDAENGLEPLIKRNMTGFMTAVALHRRCLGVYISFSVDALSMRRLRLQVESDNPEEALSKLPTVMYSYRGEVAEEDAAARPQGESYILKKSDDTPLPETLAGVRFVLGIKTTTRQAPATPRRRQTASSTPQPEEQLVTQTYFSLTTNPGEALFGLYLTTDHPEDREERLPDRVRLVNEEGPGLNGRGSRPRGYVCPRHWLVYKSKPAKVTTAAWEKLSSHTRKQHRLAIEDLQNMPHDLLALDLAAAAIRLIHRAARLRNWKASTIVSKFATMHGALMHLPLYTDQPHPINLKESPEWTSAYGRWHQLMHSEIPNPPPHVLKEHVDAAGTHLRDDVEAHLFLAMMWSFAARPGDIGGLRATDIHMRKPTRDSYPVGLTYRRGKATHFRGPYPVASHLSRQDGSQLAHLISQRPNDATLFQDPARTKQKVRAALKKVDEAFELASVRKGAVHHLARAGVPEGDIMRLTGHTNVITLRRYLNYSQQPTLEAETAQDNAAALLRDPTP